MKIYYKERQSNKILSSFGDAVNKAVTFIKTEKDIYDSLNSLVKKFESAITEIKADKAILVSKIGSEPNVVDYHYSYDNSVPKKRNKLEYKRYPYGYELDKVNGASNTVEPVLTNINIPTLKTVEDPKIKLMSKYNDLCYEEHNLKRRKKELEIKRDNLDSKSKREHSLDGYELTSYGFGKKD